MKLHFFNRSDEVEADFPFTLVRTHRKKSASIKIIEGEVKITIPKRLSQSGLKELIRKKSPWVLEKLRVQAEMEPIVPKAYVSGESFTYLGTNYRLNLIHNSKEGVKLKGGQLLVGADGDVRAALVAWYQHHAEERLGENTVRYAKLLGVVPNSIVVREYKSRWGSCSCHGDIRYNWKIIIAPNRIVDYVVVHELCHILQHNHSSAFWSSVERVIPNYKGCRQWLKENGMRLFV